MGHLAPFKGDPIDLVFFSKSNQIPRKTKSLVPSLDRTTNEKILIFEKVFFAFVSKAGPLPELINSVN